MLMLRALDSGIELGDALKGAACGIPPSRLWDTHTLDFVAAGLWPAQPARATRNPRSPQASGYSDGYSAAR